MRPMTPLTSAGRSPDAALADGAPVCVRLFDEQQLGEGVHLDQPEAARSRLGPFEVGVALASGLVLWESKATEDGVGRDPVVLVHA